MPELLLRTKLFVPPLRPNLVPRLRLLNRLDQDARQGCKLTLVSAPAGSGKTTLLSQFASLYSRPIAWLSLDEADDDPGRFWTYLINACQFVLRGIGEAALALIDTTQSLPAETIPTLIINDLVQQKGALVLLLDDYHVIQNASIHDGLLFLLDFLPENVHLVVSTRADPPWPLARFRARNQLVEIRAQDLRFNNEEAAVFLNEEMGLDLSTEDITALEIRTEGWVAGLQLAALAMQSLFSSQGVEDLPEFVQAFGGSHLYVAEYLIEEVLRHQPEAVQTFLLQTSVLGRLSAELCDAVTGRQDSRIMLATLHQANLFVVPLDSEGRWFRYHHLFADLLRARLPQKLSTEAVSRLHLRAADWFERDGSTAEAVGHRLAAQAYEKVAALVEREARTMMFAGQVNTLRKWLDALPEAFLQGHPRLQIYRLWIDLMQEKIALSASALREKERMLRALQPSPENEQLRVELLAVLCRFAAFSGDTARAIELADEALACLPEDAIAMRARSYSAKAVAFWLDGWADKARQAYDQCMTLALSSRNYSLAAHASMMMAVSQTDYGQLHEAARTYQAIVDMGKQTGQAILFPAGQGYIGLAGIALEWNDLETAESYLHQGMTLCRKGGLAGLSLGHTLRARLCQARDDLPGARAEIALLGETGADPTGTARKILLDVAAGDLDSAARSARPWEIMLVGNRSGPQPPLLVAEFARVTLARLYLARGDFSLAQQLLDEVRVTAEPANRLGRLIEVFLFTALVDQAKNQGNVTDRGIESFAHALALAEPEGYTLLFIEESAAVAPLLRAIIGRQQTTARLRQSAQRLLDATRTYSRPHTSTSLGEGPGLVEPLTSRELEVLQRIAAGESNQAIADELVITVRTVKKHASNIYGKLNVNNRTQAATYARLIGLLPLDQ